MNIIYNMYENRCSFSINQIKEVFRSRPIFNSNAMDFPTTYDYNVIENHNKFVRDHIKLEFESLISCKKSFIYPNNMPEYYAIGMALFMYRSDTYKFMLLNNWNEFSQLCNAKCFVKQLTKTITNNQFTYCLCCHPITTVIIIRYDHPTNGNGYYTMLGTDCILKSSIISLTESYDEIIQYTCIGCKNSYKKQYDLQDTCKRCSKKHLVKKSIMEYVVKITPKIIPIVKKPIENPDNIKIIWCKKQQMWVENINCRCL